jgi:hypothetical protein
MIMWDVVLALVLAVLFDWKGFLPKWIADRLAALLALYAFSRIVAGTPAAAKLLEIGNSLAKLLGQLAGKYTNAQTAGAISQYLVAVIVLVVGLLWVAAMLPAESTRKFGGDIVSREMSSWDIWGGALALTVGAYLVPGTIGDGLRMITSLGVQGGQGLIGLVS